MYSSGRLLLSIKKEVSGTFPFTCSVTVLPVSYCRRLTLCTALSASPPGHPGLPAATCIYVVGLSPIELNVLIICKLSFQIGPVCMIYLSLVFCDSQRRQKMRECTWWLPCNSRNPVCCSGQRSYFRKVRTACALVSELALQETNWIKRN